MQFKNVVFLGPTIDSCKVNFSDFQCLIGLGYGIEGVVVSASSVELMNIAIEVA